VKRAILFVFISLGGSTGCLASDSVISFKLYRGYLILAKCSVANQPDLSAIIDTGTTETILDLQVVRRLSLETRADAATALTKDTAVQGVSIPDLQFGPVRIAKLEGISMDLTFVSRELGIHPDVVIGMDVLHRANFVIDYKTQVITFGSSPALAHGSPLAPGLRFALIDSNVLGRHLRLQVDTGFNGLLLYGRCIEESALIPVGTGARVSGVSRASSARTVESQEVRVGNWHASRVLVAVMDDAPTAFAEFAGLLGPRLLSTRRVAFDFDHRMLYWD
jgi:predicted aspartyl protease